MAGIFICYRREGSASESGRIFDHLARHFGLGTVFKDVESIYPGRDFAEVVLDKISKCDAFLAVIGPQWLAAKDPRGNPRLEDSADWVRLEIEAALRTNSIRLIPVLLEGARLPRQEQLPATLEKMARCQAVEIRNASFTRDVQNLIEVVEAYRRDPSRAARAPVIAPALRDELRKHSAQLEKLSRNVQSPAHYDRARNEFLDVRSRVIDTLHRAGLTKESRQFQEVSAPAAIEEIRSRVVYELGECHRILIDLLKALH